MEGDWECGQTEGRRKWSVEGFENLVYKSLSLSVPYIDVSTVYIILKTTEKIIVPSVYLGKCI